MKKKLIVALSSTLAVAMALPAFAKDHSINGYFRVRGIIADTSFDKDQDPVKFVDQRARFKWTMGLNEYVSVTYFGEVDMQYGDTSYGAGTVYKVPDGTLVGSAPDGKPDEIKTAATRNDGGRLGGDTVNLETKNLYLDVKIPETPVSARLGLQGFADNWDYLLFASDMAGVSLRGNFGMVNATGGWFKWQEGSEQAEDDFDLWALQLGFAPMDNLKIGVDGYYMNGNAKFSFPLSTIDGAADLYYFGVTGEYKLPMVTVDGWVVYNGGTIKDVAAGGKDLDISGWGATLRGTVSVAGAKLTLRGLYFSADDDAGDSDWESVRIPTTLESIFFIRDNLMIFLGDGPANTYTNDAYLRDHGVAAGYGLWGVTLSGSYVPPMMKQVYVKGGLGYFGAVEDNRKTEKAEGKSFGTEVALRVGYKLAEVVDLSLNGAYAFLGDFYDKTANNNSDDPDNPYKFYAMVNVSY